MQSRTVPQLNSERIFSDAMNETPTFTRSVFDNFAQSIATPFILSDMLDPEFRKKPEGQAILNNYEAINLQRQAPNMGWGQWLASEGAGMLGFGLNPLNLMAGAVTGAATRGVASLAGRGLSNILPDAASVFMRKPLADVLSKPIAEYIPKMVGKEGAEKPLSTALLTEKSLENFGTFSGSMVPQATVENYNRDTGNINWGGVAREASEMGAFGLAIGAIPFAWGVVRGKINRGLGRGASETLEKSQVDSAFDKGFITKDEHAWYVDYLEHLKDPSDTAKTKELQDRGSELINQNGHRANTVSNEALFEIMTNEDVSNFHGVIADQLASAHLPEEQRMALTDYIVHNRMDYIRQNPRSLDGVRGYVDFINQKLTMKRPKLEEADRILDEHLTRGVKENMPFSQKEMFKMMRKFGFESSHMQHLPVTIPDNMIKHINMLDKINKLKEKIKSSERKNKKYFYYRGHPKPDYPGQIGGQYQNLFEDTEFGKGQWYAKSVEHARHYGEVIKELKGVFNIYDVTTGKNHKLNLLYEKIKIAKKQFYKELKGSSKYYTEEQLSKLKILRDEFISEVKREGYEGLSRREGRGDAFGLRTRVNGIAKAKPEIMFFEPKRSDLSEYIPNKQTLRRIEELEKKLPPILTPKEELAQLRHTLLTKEKGLPTNYASSKAYHRLMDLASVWHNARTLLDRVNLEEDYNRQEAFRDIAHQTLRISESNMPALAKPENVYDYLKARIESGLSRVETKAELDSALTKYETVPTDSDAILHEQDLQIKNTGATDSHKDFTQTSERFKEFRDKEGIFKNLISCVMGGLGG